MTTSITINSDNNQINTSISFVVPMSSTIIIKFPSYRQSNDDFHSAHEYKGHSDSLQTNNKKQVQSNEIIIHVKDETKDIKPNDNYTKEEDHHAMYDIDERLLNNDNYTKEEEHHAMYDIDERLLNNNSNMYNTSYSPISTTDSTDTQIKQVYVPENYDDNYNVMIKETFQDISEIVEYLKQDIIMN